jgi:hypothetical protein
MLVITESAGPRASDDSGWIVTGLFRAGFKPLPRCANVRERGGGDVEPSLAKLWGLDQHVARAGTQQAPSSPATNDTASDQRGCTESRSGRCSVASGTMELVVYESTGD